MWVRFPLEEMKYLLKFIFPFLLGQARRWFLPLNTQCLQNSAESGERSVTKFPLPKAAVCGIQCEADNKKIILNYKKLLSDLILNHEHSVNYYTIIKWLTYRSTFLGLGGDLDTGRSQDSSCCCQLLGVPYILAPCRNCTCYILQECPPNTYLIL